MSSEIQIYTGFQAYLLIMQMRPLAHYLNTGTNPPGYDFSMRSADVLTKLREVADNNGIPWQFIINLSGLK